MVNSILNRKLLENYSFMRSNLISKIDDIYLSDNAVLWLSEFLSDRFGQVVKIVKKSS
jgi:hypothetical protein